MLSLTKNYATVFETSFGFAAGIVDRFDDDEVILTRVTEWKHGEGVDFADLVNGLTAGEDVGSGKNIPRISIPWKDGNVRQFHSLANPANLPNKD